MGQCKKVLRPCKPSKFHASVSLNESACLRKQLPRLLRARAIRGVQSTSAGLERSSILLSHRLHEANPWKHSLDIPIIIHPFKNGEKLFRTARPAHTGCRRGIVKFDGVDTALVHFIEQTAAPRAHNQLGPSGRWATRRWTHISSGNMRLCRSLARG